MQGSNMSEVNTKMNYRVGGLNNAAILAHKTFVALEPEKVIL